MTENKLKEVAQLMGLELNEKFNIIGLKNNPYYFCMLGLVNKDGKVRENVLLNLLRGLHTIEKRPILNNKEKIYLENALRPFKNRIKNLAKVETPIGIDGYFIGVHFTDGEIMVFPRFPEDKMYKGMELYKEYSLKELGLFEDKEGLLN